MDLNGCYHTTFSEAEQFTLPSAEWCLSICLSFSISLSIFHPFVSDLYFFSCELFIAHFLFVVFVYRFSEALSILGMNLVGVG